MSKAGELLTAREVAERLHVSVRTVWRWRAEGVIPAVRLPTGRFRFDWTDVKLACLGSGPLPETETGSSRHIELAEPEERSSEPETRFNPGLKVPDDEWPE